MTTRDLIALVDKGEGQRLEFKKKVDYPEKVLKEIVAFANTDGGDLLIGIEDNGLVSGLNNPEGESFVLKKAIRDYCNPHIEFHVEEIPISGKKSVLKFNILKSTQKPHFVKHNNSKQCYIRVLDKSVKASFVVNEILRRRNSPHGVNIRINEHDKILLQHLENHKSITLRRFSEISGLNKYAASRRLIKLVLANVLKIEPSENEDRFFMKEIA